MCTVSAALGIGALLVGYEGQRQQAKAMERGYAGQAAEQQRQIEEKALTDKQQRMREAQAERARIRTAAAEAGVAGPSLAALLRSTYMAEGMDVSMIEQERVSRKRASRTQHGIYQASISRPNLFLTGLQIAGQGYGAYAGSGQTQAGG